MLRTSESIFESSCVTITTVATSNRVQTKKPSTKRGCREQGSSRTSCPRNGSGLASLDWAGSGLGWPDLAWASACRPAWVALGHTPGAPCSWVPRLGCPRLCAAHLVCASSCWPGSLEFAGAAASRRKEGRKEEKRKKEEKKERRERSERGGEEKEKKNLCSGFRRSKPDYIAFRVFRFNSRSYRFTILR